jgi:single-stranded-DNA-specific exonuclease
VPAADLAPLVQGAGVTALVAELLVRRGIASAEAARRFLEPALEHLHDPFGLRGMEDAVRVLAEALATGARIVVSGDYDVDGITSSALLTDFLRRAGAAGLQTFVPNRFDHGYGLTPRTVEALLALRPALVVTVDNGITAIGEVERLRAAGVTTVITDHHLPRAAGVPPGIVVNPLQPGCPYPYKRISGCGVTFKLVTALRKRLREAGWWSAARPEPNLKDWLDLVAIGTVADVVPLTEENRVLVRHGLQVLNRPQQRPGIAALLRLGRPGRGDGSVTARTIGFQIGPRLNAAGRMKEGQLGVDLLLAGQPDEAQRLALLLDEANTERRSTGEDMLREALARIQADRLDHAAGIVVTAPGFHEGVIGILAARLVERYQRPVVVLAESNGALKGSARSVPGVNVTEAITSCAALLIEYGGHAGAGGLKLPADRLAAFREGFLADCARQLETAETPSVWLDGRLDPRQVSLELAGQMDALEPFGQDNAEPTFLVHGSDLREPTVRKDKHLIWRIGHDADMVGWNLARLAPQARRLRYRVRMGVNEFNGRRTAQLTVVDTAPEE